MQVYLYDNLKYPDLITCYLCNKIITHDDWKDFDLVPYCQNCQCVAQDNWE